MNINGYAFTPVKQKSFNPAFGTTIEKNEVSKKLFDYADRDSFKLIEKLKNDGNDTKLKIVDYDTHVRLCYPTDHYITVENTATNEKKVFRISEDFKRDALNMFLRKLNESGFGNNDVW